MLGGAKAAGHEVVSDPKLADVLVVNTCAFIEEAREQSIQTILSLAGMKERNGGARLIVTGCMAERYARELADAMPEIDCLVGTGSLDRFNEALEASGRGSFTGLRHYMPTAGTRRDVDTTEGWAYLKVSEGCDHDCSFCVIPSFKGRHESRSVDDVIAEAELLVARGVVEVNLVAQDLSAYGRDIGEKEGLATLLHRLGRIDGLRRIRCYYLYPSTLSDAILDAVNDVESVCPYIDIPLQHADHEVLRLMRRGSDASHLRGLIARVREKVDGAVLRSAFIVGFPGETDDAFDRLYDFVGELRFDRIGVFCFSPEDGSSAAGLPKPVPPALSRERRDRLLALQESVSYELLAQQVGVKKQVLVCGKDGTGAWFGRTDAQGPEVDGVTWLDGDRSTLRGRIVEARVGGSDAYDLFAMVEDGCREATVDPDGCDN